MNSKQRIAIVAPLMLIGVMYVIFNLLANAFGDSWRIAWYLGLIIYWLIWGGIFSSWMIGKESIRRIVRPQKLTLKILGMVLFPLAMAGLYKLIPGMAYDHPSIWLFLLLVSTTLGNGFFEELLWRGVYMEIFPNNILWRIIWPSIWFALWHYVPVSIAPDGNILGYIIGSGLMGFYLSLIARKTGTIYWTIIAHAVGGFIMIL
ncbi:MAG: CPBP family glutamic-type intramembrane protease [Anaerolineales bacterium]|jgi:membrane protease YdiL (CAAX protease family)